MNKSKFLVLVLLVLAGCSSMAKRSVRDPAGATDAAAAATTTAPAVAASDDDGAGDGAEATYDVADPDSVADDASPRIAPPPVRSAITHLVMVVMENHSFDSYFGNYCKAPTGSNPTCEEGRNCCEAGPATDARTGVKPLVLTDKQNHGFDPNHQSWCEMGEMNHGKMDSYVQGTKCSAHGTFAYANESSASSYWRYADKGALADRYFQSIVGASWSNDMYLARAQYVFTDNRVQTSAIGSQCRIQNSIPSKVFDVPTIGDVLSGAGVSWAFYSEGYRDMLKARRHGRCPKVDKRCAAKYGEWVCYYDPTDNPFQYFKSTMDNLDVIKDHDDFFTDIAGGTLPSVSYLKPTSAHSEHPGESTISEGMKFVDAIVSAVQGSGYAENTLVLLTYDETGGFYDHITPPAKSAVDKQFYGPRIPMIAVGRFARKGVVSHVEMEHASVTKFIEWNWLGDVGQLHGRDAVVNNIGSLLDSSVTGAVVPAH